MALCDFCGVNETTATLAAGESICWRPCYAALNKMIGGLFVAEAFLSALKDVPHGLALGQEMLQKGCDLDSTYRQLVRYALWRNAEYVLPAPSPALTEGVA